MRACGRLFKPKLPESGNPLWIGWRVAGRPSSCASLSDQASGSNTPKIPHLHSTSEAKRSECVGLSACVKHGHVVQSKYCKWLPLDYFRPSIQTQTLISFLVKPNSGSVVVCSKNIRVRTYFWFKYRPNIDPILAWVIQFFKKNKLHALTQTNTSVQLGKGFGHSFKKN